MPGHAMPCPMPVMPCIEATRTLVDQPSSVDGLHACGPELGWSEDEDEDEQRRARTERPGPCASAGVACDWQILDRVFRIRHHRTLAP